MNIDPSRFSAAIDTKQLNETINKNQKLNLGAYEPFFNDPQEILNANPLVQMSSVVDREFYSKQDNKDKINRVKVRNAFRSLYGRHSLELTGRELNDDQVDTMLRKYYKTPEGEDIDYNFIKEDMDFQLRQKYDLVDPDTGERKFTPGESINAVLGKVLKVLELGTEKVTSAALGTLMDEQAFNYTVGYQAQKQVLDKVNPVGLVYDTDSIEAKLYNWAKWTKSNVPGMIDFLTDNMEFNIYELDNYQGSGGLGGYLKEVAAVLTSNADSLLIGRFLPLKIAMPYMMIKESEDFEAQAREEAGLKSYYTREEYTPELQKKLDIINNNAQRYGLVSGAIEYAQTLALLRTGGISKGVSKKAYRKSLNSVKAFFKTVGYNAIENVSEEALQQIASNYFTNLSNRQLNKEFGLNLNEKLTWYQGVGDAVDGALKMTVGMGLFGGAKSSYSRYFGETKRWLANKEQMLIEDFGLDQKVARKFAIKLGKARQSESETIEVVKEIYEASDISSTKEAGRRNSLREKLLNKQLGLASNNGQLLQDNDWDRLAILYTEKELRELSPANADTFIKGVYGDETARNNHNKEIIKQRRLNNIDDDGNIGDQSTRETRNQKETVDELIDKYEDLDEPVEIFINEIRSGFHDSKLETTGDTQNDSLFDRRQAAIQKVLDLRGKLKEGQTRTETADLDDNFLDDFSVVKSEAERLGVEVEGDKRTSEYKNRLRKAVEKARAEERADEQEQDVEDVDKRKSVNRRQKYLNIMLQKGRKALSKIAPNVKIKFAKNSRDFERITGKFANGYYDMKGTIWLNPDRATWGTLAHEITHAIFHQRLKTDARIRYVANRILNDMIDLNSLDESVQIRIRHFQRQNAEAGNIKDLDEEGLAELVSIMVDSFNALIPRTQNKIKAWLRKIFGNWIPSLKDNETALKMLQVIAAKTSRGEAILASDVALLDQIGQEKTDLELSEESTEESNQKFQLSFHDPISNLDYYYDADLFNLYIKQGYLTKHKKPSDFAGQQIVLHSPDSMFSGNIYRDDVLLIKGQGGVYYPIKYLQKGYFWASTKDAAESLARLLNESADGQGKVLMGLTNGGREKLFSSSNGSIGVVNLFENLIDSGQISMTKEQLSYVLIRASSELNQVSGDINKVKGMLAGRYIDPVTKDSISFRRRKNFTLDVIRKVAEVAKGNAKLEYELRTFYKSIIVNDIPISKSTSEIIDSQSLFTLGRLHLSEMMTEPTLKNELNYEDRLDRDAVGDLYAIIEMQGTVEAIATPEHDTYGYSIVSTSGQKPILHMLSQRSDYKDSIVDINGNSLVPTQQQIEKELNFGKAKNERDAALNIERRIFPTTGTSTQVLRVSDEPGKAQLSPIVKTNKNLVETVINDPLTKEEASQLPSEFKEGQTLVKTTFKNAFNINNIDNPKFGHCYVAAESLWHLLGAKESKYKPQRLSFEVNGEKYTHWYLKNDRGEIVDPTAEQFKVMDIRIPYELGVGNGFLTKEPSKRSQIVINRVNEAKENTFDVGKQQLATSVNAASFFSGTRTLEFPMISNKLINWKLAVEYEEDINDLANSIFNTKFPARDITKMNPKDFLDQNLEFMHFSPPCQFFSKLSNNQKSKMTPQQLEQATKLELKIAKKVAEFIEVIKPNNLTIENVPGYIDSPHWNDVIRPALFKAGYKVEAVLSNAADYGGITSRERVIVRATRVKKEDETFVDFPPLPKEVGPGDWKKAFAPYIKELPVEPVEDFGEVRVGTAKMHQVINKLFRDQQHQMQKYSRDKFLFMLGNGDSTFVPEGYSSQALTAGWAFEKSRRGEKDKVGRKVKRTIKTGKYEGELFGGSNQGRIGIPATYLISKLMEKYTRQQSLEIFAQKYGCSIKEANDAYMSPTGYLFKRINTKILLISMGFNPKLSEVMSDRISLNAAVLGNGMHGNTTRFLVEPMIGWDGESSVDFETSTRDEIKKIVIEDEIDPTTGKFSLSTDLINSRIAEIEKGQEQRQEEETKPKQSFIEEEEEDSIEEQIIEENDIDNQSSIMEDEYETSEDFYNDNVDTSILKPDERYDNDNTDTQDPNVFKLRIEDIQRILEHYSLSEMTRVKQIEFSTLLAEAAKFLQNDPSLAFKIAQSISSNPRALTGLEHAIMMVRTAQLVDQIEEIHVSESRSRVPSTINMSPRTETAINELQEILHADGLAGSISGQQLSARRMALHGNNTVAGILRRMQRAKKNNTKTSKQTEEKDIATATKLAKEYKEATKKIEQKKAEIEAEANKEIKDESETFIDKEKKKRGTKAAKKLLAKEKEVRQKAASLGFDLKNFGKAQAFSITAEQAKVIRDLAKILVYKNLRRYDNVENIVDEISNALPGASDYDILNAIAGNIQKSQVNISEAQKRLRAITSQANKLQKLQDRMEELFGSKPSKPPSEDDFTSLRKQLNELFNEIVDSPDYDPVYTKKLLTTISQIGMLVDGYYKTVKKPSKKKIDNINKISDIVSNTKKGVKLLDRIELLRGIIEGDVLPVDNDKEGPPRSEENKKLQRLRARIAQLETKIKEDKKDKRAKEREEQNQAELQQLVREILGWYRQNKPPKNKKPKSKISKAKEQAKREQRLQDTLAELEAILMTGKIPPEMYGKLYKQKAQVADPFKFRERIQELRQELKETEYYKQLEDFSWLNKRKDQVKKRLDELNRILEEGDFEAYKKPKREKEMDQELIDLLEAQRIAERKINRAIDELRDRTEIEVIGDWLSLPRAFNATADISVKFRQALFLGTTMPKEYYDAVKGGLKAIGFSYENGKLNISDKVARDIMITLENDEMQFQRDKAGLFFSTIDTGLSISEEAFNSRALEKIYGVKGIGDVSRTVMSASERDMVITLNLLRAAAFDGYYQLNPNASDAELKKAAFFINVASGRGYLGKNEAGIQSLSVFFFSPRFAVSRFQLPLWSLYAGIQVARGQFSKNLKTRERLIEEGFTKNLGKYIGLSWAKFGATMTGLITLAVLGGASFGFDPEEEDYLKISIGNLRLDIFGGLGPGFRLWGKSMYSTFNRDADIDMSSAFLNTAFKYKASPWISKGYEIMYGKDYVNRQEVPFYVPMVELVTPIHFANAVENAVNGVPLPLILGETAAEMTGIGAYTVD
tara:strand:- start:5520 stop:14852 length:9333 start_codon:yes stop_codon:yes gene_type:complete